MLAQVLANGPGKTAVDVARYYRSAT